MVIIDISVTLLRKSQFVLHKCTEIQLHFSALFPYLPFYFLLSSFLSLPSSLSSHVRIQCFFFCLLTGKKRLQCLQTTWSWTKKKISKIAINIQIRSSNFILNMKRNLNHNSANVEVKNKHTPLKKNPPKKTQNMLWNARIRCDLCCTSNSNFYRIDLR